MRFQIQHTTRYRYSRPVFLEPHTLRFAPRSDASQTVTQYQLEVEPVPRGRTDFEDATGNMTTFVWFDGTSESLTFDVQATVETSRTDPFDFLVDPNNRSMPIPYTPADRLALLGSLKRVTSHDGQDPVQQMARSLLSAADDQTIPFLVSLNQSLYSELEINYREMGPPWTPVTTLKMKRGACRDAAWLFVDACRSVGLASRFVSGYQQGDPEQDQRDLHAWAEVYLPNAGWRGFDPTQGLVVGDRHVAVAAAAQPEGAAPVTGTMRGADAEGTMEVQLQVMVSPPRNRQR